MRSLNFLPAEIVGSHSILHPIPRHGLNDRRLLQYNLSLEITTLLKHTAYLLILNIYSLKFNLYNLSNEENHIVKFINVNMGFL